MPGSTKIVDEFALAHGEPIHATNLTAALAGAIFDGTSVRPEDYAATVDLVEQTQGSAFHLVFDPSRQAQPKA